MKEASLPKYALLKKGFQFDMVYKNGTRVYGDHFTLLYLDNELSVSRLGVSVHRKIKGAAKRNRIKRIIKESFRLYREKYPDCSDIVFTVRPGFSLNSPQDICCAVEQLIKV